MKIHKLYVFLAVLLICCIIGGSVVLANKSTPNVPTTMNTLQDQIDSLTEQVNALEDRVIWLENKWAPDPDPNG